MFSIIHCRINSTVLLDAQLVVITAVTELFVSLFFKIFLFFVSVEASY